jgi:hypothetical protein
VLCRNMGRKCPLGILPPPKVGPASRAPRLVGPPSRAPRRELASFGRGWGLANIGSGSDVGPRRSAAEGIDGAAPLVLAPPSVSAVQYPWATRSAGHRSRTIDFRREVEVASAAPSTSRQPTQAMRVQISRLNPDPHQRVCRSVDQALTRSNVCADQSTKPRPAATCVQISRPRVAFNRPICTHIASRIGLIDRSAHISRHGLA